MLFSFAANLTPNVDSLFAPVSGGPYTLFHTNVYTIGDLLKYVWPCVCSILLQLIAASTASPYPPLVPTRALL